MAEVGPEAQTRARMTVVGPVTSRVPGQWASDGPFLHEHEPQPKDSERPVPSSMAPHPLALSPSRTDQGSSQAPSTLPPLSSTPICVSASQGLALALCLESDAGRLGPAYMRS